MDIGRMLEQTGAHLKGHFLLSSGRHSDHYFQCARLLQHPELAEKAGVALAELFATDGIEVVVAPALGGIIIGHEVARALGVRCLFAERAGAENQLALRRGFEIQPGEKVLIVEDVVTTGGSVLELKRLVDSHEGKVMGYASIVDRASEPVPFEAPWKALIRVQVNNYSAEECPLCKQGSTPVKPGSRKS